MNFFGVTTQLGQVRGFWMTSLGSEKNSVLHLLSYVSYWQVMAEKQLIG